MRAAQENNVEVIQFLIEKGADIDAKDYYGLNALNYAIMNEKAEAAEVLILEGIDVNVQDNDGFTPLMHAISNRNDEIILMILTYSNVDLTMKNKDQMTAYDIAIAKGYYDIAIKLKVN